MRPQLLVGGIIVALMGVLFYAFPLPLVYFWSLPFAFGGAIMAAASFFVSESSGPVQPPEGFRFCAYCSTPVPLDAERCPRCNGLQPKEGR
jgi:hypothetical protein